MLKKIDKYIYLFILQVVIWKVVSNSNYLRESWYTYFIKNYNLLINSITSKINFPLGELLYLVIVITIIVYIIYLIRNIRVNKQFKVLLISVNIVYFIYQSCWGISYLIPKFKIENTKLKLEENDLKDMYYMYLNEAKLLRNDISVSEKNVLQFNLDRELILKEYKNVNSILANNKWINNYIEIKNPTYKYSKCSDLLIKLGILGYYNPFSVESNVNRYNTDLKQIPTIYHELAHQMGFSSENEANFISFIISYNSEIPEIRYAALYKIIFTLLKNISKFDESFSKNEIKNLPELIKRDYESEVIYYQKFDSKLNDVFSFLNNQFLKFNNQEGIISYSKYIILVSYYNQYNKKNN